MMVIATVTTKTHAAQRAKEVVQTGKVSVSTAMVKVLCVEFMERQLAGAAELEFKFGLLQKEVLELRTQVGAVRADIAHRLPELVEKMKTATANAQRYQRSAWMGDSCIACSTSWSAVDEKTRKGKRLK